MSPRGQAIAALLDLCRHGAPEVRLRAALKLLEPVELVVVADAAED